MKALSGLPAHLENLRVPLLTGEPRTVLLTNDEEAVCIDVVFNPAVLYVALAGVGEEQEDGDESKPRVKRPVGKARAEKL